MNKVVVVFLKSEPHVYQLIESGVFIGDLFVQDHRIRCSAIHSKRADREGASPFWKVCQEVERSTTLGDDSATMSVTAGQESADEVSLSPSQAADNNTATGLVENKGVVPKSYLDQEVAFNNENLLFNSQASAWVEDMQMNI
ncbi:uncharacterized protein AKAME5_002829200 [Lates japonicus]|uniref:Uncharacterized protein n=1 Tax=Lates japonicus TaxID=270547 RepID=A0AAD3MFT1_LATJO|nr:uncharacterized protein AKAME5_002829200 [Lates japonicus]